MATAKWLQTNGRQVGWHLALPCPVGSSSRSNSMEKKPSPPSRRWFCWLPRLLLLVAVVYASVALFWAAHSVGAFTKFQWEGSLSDRNKSTSLSATIDRVSIRDFPSGETRRRNLQCSGWRATQKCSPEGPREPSRDKNCTTIVSKGESGYCEVEDVDSGERFRAMRRHCNSLRHGVAFKCQDAPQFVNLQVDAHEAEVAALEPNFTLPNVAERQEPPRDGIVMVVYPKLLASAYATIRVLRDVHRCQLPIEIWFRPDEMKPNEGILRPLRHLAAKESNITFQEIHDRLAKRFVAKVHAIYHSSFDRVMFLDADNVPVRDPTFLFESPEFVKTGAVFWPDFWHPSYTIFGIHENSLLWEYLDIPYVEMFEQESGQLVVDRRRHAAPLELVRFYARYRPNVFSTLKLAWGDKDLFRLAWLKLEVPFHMIQTPPGMAGTVVNSFLHSDFCGMTMVQHDAEGEVLFMHRNQHKLTGLAADKTEDGKMQEQAVDVVSTGAESYPDPAIWTHLMRFNRQSSRRYYEIQLFYLAFPFEANQKCYGRRDVYRNPHFYVQEIGELNFSALETQLRSYALQSTQFSPDS